MTKHILYIILIFFFLCNCSHLSSNSSLKNFKADEGHYFPLETYNIFPNAKKFEDKYPTIKKASKGIKIIDIIPLNNHIPSQNESNLSWSADGMYLSYELNKLSKRHIMIRGLDNNYNKQLAVVNQGRDTFLSGFLSPEIASYNSSLSWSKDSTRFLFMSNGGIGNYNLYIGSIGSKETSIAESPTKDGYGTWSPTDNSIAFVSGRSGNGDIYLIDLDEDEIKRLSFSEKIDIFPEWTKDGKHIIYSSGLPSNHDLFLLSRQDNNWLKPHQLTNTPNSELRPMVSPDGRFVAFYANNLTSSSQDNWNIHVLRLNPSKTYTRSDIINSVVARNVVVDLNTGPSWTPDSRKIFFVKKDHQSYNPIWGYDIFSGKSYKFQTNTKMNRDILISQLGIISFRAQSGAWDKVYVGLTNQGIQIQKPKNITKNYVSFLKWFQE